MLYKLKLTFFKWMNIYILSIDSKVVLNTLAKPLLYCLFIKYLVNMSKN